ncbi:MAG TPA: hypothetical protein VFU19_04060 [Iamia sp.]|nr:hypothetical protein [Iamia sp.]
MDELAVLTRHRPDPAPPTAAERDAIRARVMGHVSGADPAGAPVAPDRLLVDLGAPPRPTRRRLARALVAAAAAAIVVVAVVMARSGGEPDGTPVTTPEREELPAVPYPAPPFTVEVAVAGESTGGSAPRRVEGRITLHRLDDETVIADHTACEGCDATSLMLNLGDRPRDGTVAEVRAAVEALFDSDHPLSRFEVIIGGLMDPASSPVVRSELLRALRSTEGLEVTEGVTTALGDVGTRYALAEAMFGEYSIVVDPTDGYVYEVASTSEPQTGPEAPDEISSPAGWFAPDGRLVTVSTIGRPVPADAVPAEMADLATSVRETSAARPGGCSSGSGNDRSGAGQVPPVPPHLAYAYCPRP